LLVIGLFRVVEPLIDKFLIIIIIIIIIIIKVGVIIINMI